MNNKCFQVLNVRRMCHQWCTFAGLSLVGSTFIGITMLLNWLKYGLQNDPFTKHDIWLLGQPLITKHFMFVNLSKKSRVNRVRKLITKRHLKYCPQRTQFKVLMNTNQGGYFQFSICPLQSSTEASTQACFDQHPVPLADGSGFRYGKDSSDDYVRTHFYYKISFLNYIYIVYMFFLWAMSLLTVGLITSISVITNTWIC